MGWDAGLQTMALPINELMCQEIEKDVQFPSLGTQEMQIKTSYFGSFTKREKKQPKISKLNSRHAFNAVFDFLGVSQDK